MQQITTAVNQTTFAYQQPKSFEVSKKKIRQLTEEDQVGINKKTTKISIANRNKELIEVTQTYFSGLVYRLDGRPLEEIIKNNGFYPMHQQEINDPLLAKDVCFTDTMEYNNQEITVFRVYSGDKKGIVSTSKNFSTFNIDFEPWIYYFKYVIDSLVDNTYGLDIDETMQLSENDKRFEVNFEEPIKAEAIVGYFKGLHHDCIFYPNHLYKGNFSWQEANVVVDYKLKMM